VRHSDDQPSTVVTANRSDTYTWYRGGSATGYSTAPKKVGTDIKRWNDAHDEFDVLPQNDRILRGKWHGSVVKNGASTWDDRTWWRIDPSAQDRFQVVLENRLMAFDVATGEVGKGIPFYVTPQGFDGMVIRYKSNTNDQNGEVRFCFDQCDAINQIQTDLIGRSFFAGLLGIFSGSR
jgi:hypothetical protein